MIVNNAYSQHQCNTFKCEVHTHKLCFFNAQNRKLIHAYLSDPLFVSGSLRRHNVSVCLNALQHKVVGVIERELTKFSCELCHSQLPLVHTKGFLSPTERSAESTHFQLCKNTTYLTYFSKSSAVSSATWA